MCVYNMVHKVEIEMYEMSHVSQQPVTHLHFHVYVQWLPKIKLNFKIKTYFVSNILKREVSKSRILLRFLNISLIVKWINSTHRYRQSSLFIYITDTFYPMILLIAYFNNEISQK